MKNLFLLLLMFCSSSVIACSCMRMEKIKADDVHNSSAVFYGKALSVEEIEDVNEFGGLKKITFEVIKANKQCSSGEQVVVYTANNSAACGVYVQQGETWYIFTDEYNGKKRISICGRNARIVKDRATKRTLSKGEKKSYKASWKRYKKEARFIRKLNN